MNDYPIELRYNLGPPVIILDQNTNLYDIIQKEVSTFQIDGRSFPSFFIIKNTIKEILESEYNVKSSRSQSNNESPTGGFIKSKWILDTCYKKPSVICYCIEPTKWNEFTNEILNELENIKLLSRSLHCHLLILIKINSANELGSEEFSSMKKKIGLDSKYILQFSLKNTSESMKLLESMLKKSSYEHFYSLTVKAKKEKGKTQQTPIQTIRNHFKLGFYHEKRNDLKHAFAQYQLSYNALKNLKKTWKKLEEIRTIADLLNFKLCNILFFFNKTLDGLDQFQRHIDIYKNITGDPEKEYTHYAFLARQYHIFGELLEAHSIHTNTDSMTKLPGYYFMISANLLKKRRELAIKLCSKFRSDEKIKALMEKVMPYKPCHIDLQQQEFVGEVVDIHQFINKDDPLQNSPTIEDASNVLIAQELKVDHGKLILETLNRASYQFKSLSSCKRLTWYLSSLMADEYKELKFYEIAKKLYDEIISYYKGDKWYKVLSNLISSALYCSIQLKLYPDIIKYNLDLLDPKINLPQPQRVKIMDEMLKCLNNIEKDKPIIIPISHDMNVFDKKICFRNVKVHMNETFIVRITITNNLPSKIKFNSINLKFNIDEYDQVLKEEQYLSFGPYEKKVIEIEINAIKIGDLYCTSLNLEYNDSVVIFECENKQAVEVKKKCNKDILKLTIFENKPEVILSVKESSPALLGEHFPIQFIFENKGIPVESGLLIIEGVKKQLACLHHDKVKEKAPRFDIPIGSINSDSTIIETVYYCSQYLEPLEFNVAFRYKTEEYVTKTEYQHIVVPVIKPLEVKTDLIYKYKHILNSKEKIYIGDKFLVNVDISPFSDILISSVKLIPKSISNDKYLIELQSSSFKENEIVQLSKTNQFNVIFSVQAINDGNSSLGDIIIEWKRSEENCPTITKFTIPSINVHQKRDYEVTVHCTNGVMGKSIDHKIVIKNMTDVIQEYYLELANASSFVVSGISKVRFKVNPHSVYETAHKLFPTKFGRVQTPTFYLKHDVNDVPILLNSISQYIFVFPS